jgi:dolichol-phosphate mannosyltransferase
MKKTISTIFSFRNEEKNILELIKRTSQVFKRLEKKYNYELIFVNDDSTDSSLEILKNNLNFYPIKIINMSRRFGSTPCVFAGFENASGDLIIYLDSDLQDPPELIENLVNKMEEGYDIVHTIRTKRLGENKVKMLITKFAYKIINYFSNIELRNNCGDFKLISRKALNDILKIKETDPYLRGLSVWIGYKQAFVEYIRDKRFLGKTHYPLFMSINPIAEFIRGIASFSTAPLYFSILIGMTSLFVSISLIIYSLYIKFTGISAPGASSIIITITFFSSMILIMLGIVGIYIARIYEQIKGRPRYIIKEIINSDKKL